MKIMTIMFIALAIMLAPMVGCAGEVLEEAGHAVEAGTEDVASGAEHAAEDVGGAAEAGAKDVASGTEHVAEETGHAAEGAAEAGAGDVEAGAEHAAGDVEGGAEDAKEAAEEKAPGFEAVFAVTGLLAVAFLVLRKE